MSDRSGQGRTRTVIAVVAAAAVLHVGTVGAQPYPQCIVDTSHNCPQGSPVPLLPIACDTQPAALNLSTGTRITLYGDRSHYGCGYQYDQAEYYNGDGSFTKGYLVSGECLDCSKPGSR